MTSISKDGIKIHYVTIGCGQSIVLLHGFGNDNTMWNEYGWTTELSKKYRLIQIDLRGCGLSDKPELSESYTIEKHIEDIQCVLNDLGENSPIIWGWSLGATICMHYMKIKNIKAAILCGSCFGPIITNAYVMKMKKIMPGKQNEIRMDAIQKWPIINPEDISTRYLIYTGTNDRNVYTKLIEQKIEIERCNNKVVVFENLDHVGLVREKEIVLDEILSYLEGIA